MDTTVEYASKFVVAGVLRCRRSHADVHARRMMCQSRKWRRNTQAGQINLHNLAHWRSDAACQLTRRQGQIIHHAAEQADLFPLHAFRTSSGLGSYSKWFVSGIDTRGPKTEVTVCVVDDSKSHITVVGSAVTPMLSVASTASRNSSSYSAYFSLYNTRGTRIIVA